MNIEFSMTDDTISINNVNYRLKDIEGNYIINRQMLKLIYAFLGLFVLVMLIMVGFVTLTQLTSVPLNVGYFVLILMVYPSFLIGKGIMRMYYFPELVLTFNGKVVFRMIEWPKYKTTVETIRNRVANIKVRYPMELQLKRPPHQ